MGRAIGRLLRAGTAGFVIGMRVSEWDAPVFGALVRIPLGEGYQIYGLIHDIHIDDDGLVRQLITAGSVDEAIIADNRENRNIPIEIGVIAVGHAQDGRIRHTLPPRPPLSLDSIYLCDESELAVFTGAGHFGYFRHILRSEEAPVGELLSAHLEQAHRAHAARGDAGWIAAASRELIVLLRDDYQTLMSVLSSLGDADIR